MHSTNELSLLVLTGNLFLKTTESSGPECLGETYDSGISAVSPAAKTMLLSVATGELETVSFRSSDSIRTSRDSKENVGAGLGVGVLDPCSLFHGRWLEFDSSLRPLLSTAWATGEEQEE